MNARKDHGMFPSQESCVGMVAVGVQPAAGGCRSAGVRTEVEAWAMRASGSNGFGAPEVVTGPEGEPAFLAAERWARTGWLKATRGWLDAVLAGWERRRTKRGQRRRWRRQMRMLEALDPRELRDMGVDRSEAGSVAAEIVGCANATRRRVRVATRV